MVGKTGSPSLCNDGVVMAGPCILPDLLIPGAPQGDESEMALADASRSGALIITVTAGGGLAPCVESLLRIAFVLPKESVCKTSGISRRRVSFSAPGRFTQQILAEFLVLDGSF